MYTSLAVVVGEYGVHGIPSTLTYQETEASPTAVPRR